MTYDLSDLPEGIRKYFEDAISERKKALDEATREVKALYRDTVDDISDHVKIRDEELEKYISGLQKELSDKLSSIISTGSLAVSTAGISIGASILENYYKKSGGILTKTLRPQYLERVSTLAKEHENKIVTGSTLKLSERIWNLSGDNLNKIQAIINAGIGTDAVDVAKALRVYVREGRETFAGQYPNMYDRMGGRVAKNLNYEGLRLARNELSEDYWNASLEGYKNNEAITGVKVLLSNNRPAGFHDICDVSAAEDLYGLGPGVYPISDAPQKFHVQCLCTLAPVVKMLT